MKLLYKTRNVIRIDTMVKLSVSVTIVLLLVTLFYRAIR